MNDPYALFIWLLLSVSLFNTITLLWLGLTVALTAERRTWGLWLASGGLLVGGVFFLAHTAILGMGLSELSVRINLWWQLGWVPLVGLPYAWYAVMLWYASFWEDRQARIHRRHRWGLLATSLLALITVILVLIANPLPPFSIINLTPLLSIHQIPLLIIAYPVYLAACLGLSLDALLQPGKTLRVMGDLARHRARPWLMIASAVLLLVSLLVGWALFWVIQTAQRGVISVRQALTLGAFDAAIAILIGVAVMLVGQSIVSYEVFTGKTLPRRGLQRYWRRALILAAGFAVLAGWAMVQAMPAIYILLLSMVLMTVFYALLSWRSFAERERYIKNLRPFVASPRLYDQLTIPAEAGLPETDARQPMHALCADLLNARLAYLVPLGLLAPLVGPGLAYPSGTLPALPEMHALVQQWNTPQAICHPLEVEQFAGAAWAIPLWSERGLIGVLLLGEKRDASLYTQEEFEIAQTVGERLIDSQASTEMARRLMALQRQYLAETQVIDRRARRTLHDEVLPRLHASLLSLNASPETNAEAIQSISEAHQYVSSLLYDLPGATSPAVSRLGAFEALRQSVAEEFHDAFDQVSIEIDPQASVHAASLSPITGEVLFYAAREAVRNAARHARGGHPSGELHLHISACWHDGLEMIIEDNGVGLGQGEKENGGSGQGLALHSTLMAVIGGTLTLESASGEWTRLRLWLPETA
ncbi:MAG: hypothetical protein JW726_01160 [Anaerolineales bacterium]|nr:hypothetical protein [Anaerolineales bacterium]